VKPSGHHDSEFGLVRVHLFQDVFKEGVVPLGGECVEAEVGAEKNVERSMRNGERDAFPITSGKLKLREIPHPF